MKLVDNTIWIAGGFVVGACLSAYTMLDGTTQAIQQRDDALKELEYKDRNNTELMSENNELKRILKSSEERKRWLINH